MWCWSWGNPASEIYNRLLKDRIIILGTDVNDDILAAAASAFILATAMKTRGHAGLGLAARGARS